MYTQEVLRLSSEPQLSGNKHLKSFGRWKTENPVTTILYFICNYVFLGWNWKIIRIEAMVLSTTIFQIFSLALPLSVFMKLHFLSCIWFFNLLFLHSWYGSNHLWKLFFFLVIAVTTTMLIVLIQNFLHNLLLNIKPNWSVCDKRKITF